MKTKYNQLLLVEGTDDQHVIWALCQKYNITQNFEVIDCKGIDKLYAQVPIYFKQAGIKTVGIVVDADIDLKSRWEAISLMLNKLGFLVPHEFPKTGLIIGKAEGQKVGVWIMPNNDLNGMLEDFIQFLIPQDDKLLPTVMSTLQAIEEQGLNKYAPIHKAKAIIHCWLSLQETPGTPMGLGITKRYLTTDEPICLAFIQWLQDLFDES